MGDRVRGGLGGTRVVVVGVVLLVLGAAAGHGQPRDVTVQPVRPAHGEPRVALVVGNAAYGESPLNNPANDARAIARTLRGQGFDVIERVNADLMVMRRAVAEFGDRMREGGVALFYYSGHGLQVNGKNFLVPIGAQIKSENYVGVETVNVDDVLAQMDDARNRINVVVLDACRNNPFARRFRSQQGGLAFMQAPLGTFIAYATSPGDVAEDGPAGGYGLFTGELLSAMREAGRIEDVFKRVALAVQQKTQRRQTPWVASNLTGDFSFVAPMSTPPPPAPRFEVREEVRQPLGSVGLSAAVDGVEVYLGDQRLGELRPGRTLVVDNLAAGQYRVKARKAGHAEWEREISVTGNQRAEVSIDLEPKWVASLAKGKDHYKAGEYTAAAPLLRSAATDGSPEAMIHLALFYDTGRGGVARDEAEAARWLRQAADLGDARAMGKLGQMYRRGRGIAQDDAEGLRWYQRAANAGNGYSMTALGFLHERGIRGVNKDDAAATRWFRKAVDALRKDEQAGHAEAMTSLGFMYEHGRGDLPRDEKEALRWYRKAVDAGDDWALASLGHMYETGRGGVPEDAGEAVRWYRRGADVGNEHAVAFLGLMYETGRGVPKDGAEAVRWFRKGADAGSDIAMLYLGDAYERGGAGLARDEAEAGRWFRKAADLGNSRAMLSLGIMYEDGRGALRKDGAEAVRWFRKGAEAGNEDAMAVLGFNYRDGRGGLARDDAEAVRWFRQAAEAGVASAMGELGVMYEDGRGGLAKDEIEALRWYRRAAEAGNSHAMANLGIMHSRGRGGLLRDDAEAVRWFRKGADAGGPAAMHALAWAYEHGRGVSKDRAEALRWYRKAAALGDEDATRRLKTLGE